VGKSALYLLRARRRVCGKILFLARRMNGNLELLQSVFKNSLQGMAAIFDFLDFLLPVKNESFVP
jgi:hypothetical protein